MKKEFVKPEIFEVEIRLSTAICNCDSIVTYIDSTSCQGGYSDTAEMYNMIFGVFSDTDYCSDIPDHGTVFDNICYFTSEHSIFSS